MQTIPRQVVILCGGKGTRMGDLTRDVPKPMVRLGGKPILEHQIDFARRYGAQEIIFLTGHLGEVIEAHFGDGSRWGLKFDYHLEEAPLGTAGALKAVDDLLDDRFFVFYGDTIMDIDLARLADFHYRAAAEATLVVHPNHHPYDSDLLDVDAAGQVTAFYPKPRNPACVYRNLANASLYLLSRNVLRHVQSGQRADLDREVFPQAHRRGANLRGYITPEYITDVGTPERLRSVEADVLSGKVARLNRRNPRSAVFLDRDGVLNEDANPVARGEQLRLLPGVAGAIRRINRSEHLAIVVTNQPAIAKGFMSEADLAGVHCTLETMLGAEHAFLDRIYFCPHHPEKGFPGERQEYKIACQCRKPQPGMLLSAAAELNVDLGRSFMIGDRDVDILAGAQAGCKTVLVGGGSSLSPAKGVAVPETRPSLDSGTCHPPCRPDFVCHDLAEAVNLILEGQL